MFLQDLREKTCQIDYKGPCVGTVVYGGRILSLRQKAVLKELEDGPKRRKWLFEQLTKSMTYRLLQKTLNELIDLGLAIKRAKQAEGRRNYEMWYMLPKHEYLLYVDLGKIAGAIERLKKILLRMPTVEEIAAETGIAPGDAEKITYKTADQTGWYKPAQELIESARAELGEILVCAARIRDKLITPKNGYSRYYKYENEEKLLEQANKFLKDHSNLLPQLSNDAAEVVSWPDEALKFLGTKYVPLDRRTECVFMHRGHAEPINREQDDAYARELFKDGKGDDIVAVRIQVPKLVGSSESLDSKILGRKTAGKLRH